jgi:ribosomal-protein-serine acetyltransferase
VPSTTGIIGGGDVRIRPYLVQDADAVWQSVRESLAELMPWMPWCHPAYSRAESRSWLEVQVAAFKARAAFEFAVVSSDGRYLGGCGLNQIEAQNRRANLGYWVRSSATRRGVATAAVRLLSRWAFESTELIRLEILVATGNAASLRVAERVGARREGVLRSRLLVGGRSQDAVVFSLIRGDAQGGSDRLHEGHGGLPKRHANEEGPTRWDLD